MQTLKDVPEPILDRIRKLHALASNPGATAGESDAARRMIERQLDKYRLTLEDVLKPDVRRFEFMPKTPLDRRLLIQIICHVTNTSTVWSWKAGRKRMIVELTNAQYADVESMFSFYQKQFWEQVDDFQRAFFSKHGITSESSRESSCPLSPDEVQRLLNLMRGMGALPKYRAQLPSGK